MRRGRGPATAQGDENNAALVGKVAPWDLTVLYGKEVCIQQNASARVNRLML